MFLAVYIYYNNCNSMFCVLWETRYSECRVWGRTDIVNAGSWETRYSECRVWGDQI
ncbi:unnamed protein product [Staurois parvus]|uniref:Uncharacterized protein n=1 Tax=Staurois parvus TaxID=386267 RepID=A0ABN9AUW7_9NEOB|nr:unnamed protein product [Staurois parvus]